MPVYPDRRNGPAAWRVKVWNKRTNKWVERHLPEASKTDAQAFEARLRVELERGTLQSLRVVPTFSAFCENEYKAYAETNLKKRTWSNRTYKLATLIGFFGEMKLTEIEPAQIEAFKAMRRAVVRKSTVNDELKVLVVVLNYARHLKLPVPKPEVKFLELPKKRRHAEPWSDKQVSKLFAVCARGGIDPKTGRRFPGDLRLLPILVFLANTGCRKGEALALDWSRVDVKRRIVKIWTTDDEEDDAGKTVAGWEPKDREDREVPITNALLPWLRRPREGQRWVFPTDAGQRFAFWPQRRFDLVRSAAGLQGGPHKLRHTFATHFLAKIPDLYLLGQIMGHSHARVTQLYGHLLPDHLARARTAVNFRSPLTPGQLDTLLK